MLRLVAVTDAAVIKGGGLVPSCLAAVQGGATAVQLRLKDVTARELAAAARALVAAMPVPVFVNDRLDVALAVGAVGAHLGPDDLPGDLARRICPPGFVLGASVGSPAEVARCHWADYWGTGPLRPTLTKGDAGDPLGLEGFAAVVAVAEGRPCVAIGGVLPGDVPGVLGRGGAGVAVVSGIFAGDPTENARRYQRLLP